MRTIALLATAALGEAALVNQATTVVDFGRLKLGLAKDNIVRVTFSPGETVSRGYIIANYPVAHLSVSVTSNSPALRPPPLSLSL